MRNEVVALKNEANLLVSIGVPLGILEVFGGFRIDKQITARVVIKPADDI